MQCSWRPLLRCVASRRRSRRGLLLGAAEVKNKKPCGLVSSAPCALHFRRRLALLPFLPAKQPGRDQLLAVELCARQPRLRHHRHHPVWCLGDLLCLEDVREELAGQAARQRSNVRRTGFTGVERRQWHNLHGHLRRLATTGACAFRTGSACWVSVRHRTRASLPMDTTAGVHVVHV